MDVEILCFPGVDELDVVGPYEVFSSAVERGGDLAVRVVTLEPTERIRASHGLCIEPDGRLGDPDLLVVPGGGGIGRPAGSLRASTWRSGSSGGRPGRTCPTSSRQTPSTSAAGRST